MTSPYKQSLAISLALHLLFVVALVVADAAFSPRRGYLSVDFTLLTATGQRDPRQTKTATTATLPRPWQEKQGQERQRQGEQEAHHLSLNPATSWKGTTDSASRDAASAVPPPTSAWRQQGSRYLAENFNHIKDSIRRNLRYPEVARRKGWQGTTVVSFVVASDGSVSAIKVRQTSGIGLLDENAVATIMAAAPFPPPPTPALILIPITHSLM